MKFSEIFKGRFGDFYLYKIWTFTVIIGAVLDVIVIGDFSSFFGFVFLTVLFGIIYCIPSLVLSDILYKFLSRSNLVNYKVLIFTIIFSLVTTNATYYLSYVDKMGNLVPGYYSFYKIYNICLIAGFFIFQQKTKILKK